MDVPTLPAADVSESLPAGVRIPLQVVAGEVVGFGVGYGATYLTSVVVLLGCDGTTTRALEGCLASDGAVIATTTAWSVGSAVGGAGAVWGVGQIPLAHGDPDYDRNRGWGAVSTGGLAAAALPVGAVTVGVVAESDVLTLTGLLGQFVLPPVGAVIAANLPQGHRTSVSVSPRPGGVVVAGRF